LIDSGAPDGSLGPQPLSLAFRSSALLSFSCRLRESFWALLRRWSISSSPWVRFPVLPNLPVPSLLRQKSRDTFLDLPLPSRSWMHSPAFAGFTHESRCGSLSQQPPYRRFGRTSVLHFSPSRTSVDLFSSPPECPPRISSPPGGPDTPLNGDDHQGKDFSRSSCSMAGQDTLGVDGVPTPSCY